jgi:hypothetical protein
MYDLVSTSLKYEDVRGLVALSSRYAAVVSIFSYRVFRRKGWRYIYSNHFSGYNNAGITLMGINGVSNIKAVGSRCEGIAHHA